jgi:5-oxoprolinase (ATP-hydrolysing)/N-methylhydantoinase A
MATAAKIHVIEKASDPRHYALLAYGGGGPLHGAAVARILVAPEVICPLAAGVTSAIGLLIAPLSYELVQSYPVRWDGVDLARVESILRDLHHKGKDFLAEAGVAGAVLVERSADGRFVGQLHELTVPLPSGPLSAHDHRAVQDTFMRYYQQRYGHLPQKAPLEFLSWRVKVLGPRPRLPILSQVAGQAGAPRAVHGQRRAYFGPRLGFVDTPTYDRYAMMPGMQIAGPAIFEERESTAIVPPGMAGWLDANLNLTIRTNE